MSGSNQNTTSHQNNNGYIPEIIKQQLRLLHSRVSSRSMTPEQYEYEVNALTDGMNNTQISSNQSIQSNLTQNQPMNQSIYQPIHQSINQQQMYQGIPVQYTGNQFPNHRVQQQQPQFMNSNNHHQLMQQQVLHLKIYYSLTHHIQQFINIHPHRQASPQPPQFRTNQIQNQTSRSQIYQQSSFQQMYPQMQMKPQYSQNMGSFYLKNYNQQHQLQQQGVPLIPVYRTPSLNGAASIKSNKSGQQLNRQHSINSFRSYLNVKKRWTINMDKRSSGLDEYFPFDLTLLTEIKSNNDADTELIDGLTGQLLPQLAIESTQLPREPSSLPNLELSTDIELQTHLIYRIKYFSEIKPGSIAFSMYDKSKNTSITYGEIFTKARKLASHMKTNLKVVSSQHIAILFKRLEVIDFTVSIIACLILQAIFIPITTSSTNISDELAEIEFIFQQHQIQLCLTSDVSYKSLLKEYSVTKSSEIPKVTWCRLENSIMKLDVISIEQESSFPRIAYIEYSKNITGDLKGTVITHSVLKNQFDSHSVMSDEVVLCCLEPRQHYGLVHGLLCSLWYGVRCILAKPKSDTMIYCASIISKQKGFFIC